MPIDIKAGLGGNGAYRPESYNLYNQIPPGVSGDILVLTAPVGKKVRLESLIGLDSGITITVDGVQLVDGTLKNNATGSNDSYYVSQAGTMVNATSAPYTQSMNAMTDIVGEEVKVTKNTGNTTGIIFYSYSYGVQ